MLVVTRYSVPEAEGPDFLDRARTALAALAARPEYLRGWIGRATDDPTRWLLSSEWESVGAYRRALSAYEVRVGAVPLLSLAYDEPTAYELLDEGEGVRRAADADVVGVGEAAAPYVDTGLERPDEPGGGRALA